MKDIKIVEAYAKYEISRISQMDMNQYEIGYHWNRCNAIVGNYKRGLIPIEEAMMEISAIYKEAKTAEAEWEGQK